MTDPHHHRRSRERVHGREDDMFSSPNPKRLYRSRKERVWAGVCGGIAERFGWDPIVVRLLAVASFFLFLERSIRTNLGAVGAWLRGPPFPSALGLWVHVRPCEPLHLPLGLRHGEPLVRTRSQSSPFSRLSP